MVAVEPRCSAALRALRRRSGAGLALAAALVLDLLVLRVPLLPLAIAVLVRDLPLAFLDHRIPPIRFGEERSAQGVCQLSGRAARENMPIARLSAGVVRRQGAGYFGFAPIQRACDNPGSPLARSVEI